MNTSPSASPAKGTRIRPSVQTLLLPLTILATVAILWFAKPVLVPLLFAVLLAQLLSPLVNFFEKYMPRLLAVLLSMSVLVGVVGATVSLVASQLSLLESGMPAMIARVTDALNQVQTHLEKHLGGAVPVRSLHLNNLATYAGSGGNAAVSAVTLTFEVIGQIALILVLATLMLYLRRHIRRCLKMFGQEHGTWSIGVALDRIAELGQNYIAGIAGVVVLVGVLDTLGLFLVGSPFPAVFGLICAVSVLVPYVGILVAAPSCAVVAWLVTGSAGTLGGVILVLFVVHFLEGNVLSPLWVGSKVNLNPLVTIISVLVGGELWGTAGMLLFIPLMGLIKLGLDSSPSVESVAKLLGPVATADVESR